MTATEERQAGRQAGKEESRGEGKRTFIDAAETCFPELLVAPGPFLLALCVCFGEVACESPDVPPLPRGRLPDRGRVDRARHRSGSANNRDRDGDGMGEIAGVVLRMIV